MVPTNDYGLLAALMGFLAVIIVASLIVMVLLIVSYWKIFTKAGEPGWKAIVPFLSDYTFYKLAWSTKWFWITLLLSAVYAIISIVFTENVAIVVISSLIFTIPIIVISCIFSHQLSKSFGQGGGFTAGLILLPIVFYPILAFGSAQYVRNNEGIGQQTS